MVTKSTEHGQQIHLAYNKVGDALEVVFDRIEATCAVELTDNILLRFHRQLDQAVGLTILDFSVLASRSELGPRSFALTGLETMPEDLREIVVQIITTPPVNHWIKISIFDSFSAHPIPLTTIENPYIEMVR